MAQIDVVSLVGSAVPAELQARGLLQCWMLLVDGQAQAGPFTSQRDALNCQAMWHLHYNACED